MAEVPRGLGLPFAALYRDASFWSSSRPAGFTTACSSFSLSWRILFGASGISCRTEIGQCKERPLGHRRGGTTSICDGESCFATGVSCSLPSVVLCFSSSDDSAFRKRNGGAPRGLSFSPGSPNCSWSNRSCSMILAASCCASGHAFLVVVSSFRSPRTDGDFSTYLFSLVSRSLAYKADSCTMCQVATHLQASGMAAAETSFSITASRTWNASFIGWLLSLKETIEKPRTTNSVKKIINVIARQDHHKGSAPGPRGSPPSMSPRFVPQAA